MHASLRFAVAACLLEAGATATAAEAPAFGPGCSRAQAGQLVLWLTPDCIAALSTPAGRRALGDKVQRRTAEYAAQRERLSAPPPPRSTAWAAPGSSARALRDLSQRASRDGRMVAAGGAGGSAASAPPPTRQRPIDPHAPTQPVTRATAVPAAGPTAPGAAPDIGWTSRGALPAP